MKKDDVMIGVQTLANKFTDVLKDWLSADEFAEMVETNRSDPAYEIGGACASHNYCDANMAMDEAFTATAGREFDHDSDADIALWNEAWNTARAAWLKAGQA